MNPIHIVIIQIIGTAVFQEVLYVAFKSRFCVEVSTSVAG
jgi:hypothetical protein